MSNYIMDLRAIVGHRPLLQVGASVIAVDEIGAPEDVQAIKYAMHCGCKMIATVHGETLEEIQRKPLFEQLVNERCFERYVVLQNETHVGEIAGIYDTYGKLLYQDKVKEHKK